MTAKEILYEIKDRYNIGTAWQLTEHIIIEAMEKYAQQQVKNCAIPPVSNSLDLRELERKLDEALGKETRETLTEWLKQQRQ